jgi:hypothetical protein
MGYSNKDFNVLNQISPPSLILDYFALRYLINQILIYHIIHSK